MENKDFNSVNFTASKEIRKLVIKKVISEVQ